MSRSSDPNGSENDRPATEGLSMLDVLSLPASQQQIVNWLMRQKQATLAEIATQIEQPIESVQAMLDLLIDRGFIQFLEVNGELHYQIRLVRKQNRRVPDRIWQQLNDR